MDSTKTNSTLLQHLLDRLGYPSLLDDLAEKLSGSELNTLLMELMHKKSSQLTPAAVLQQYHQNRFTGPSLLPLIAFTEFEVNLMKILGSFGYEGLILSPVAPLGSCSVIATAHQHKILSATRGTEVVADVTNVMALEASQRKKDKRWAAQSPQDKLRLFTVHRHLRTPPIKVAKFSPHFAILAWVVSGRDTGECGFEVESFIEQLHLYKTLLEDFLRLPLTVHLYPRAGYSTSARLEERINTAVESAHFKFPVQWKEVQTPNAYYQGLQYKIFVQVENQWFEIGDGGFVDWSQQLLQNKKERLLIGSIGTEFLYKLLHRTGT
jgi:hypothetical protein